MTIDSADDLAPLLTRATSGSAPDWSSVRREVKCPLCDYNLRGLVEPRCPECGYRFEWEPLIHPPAVHAYLFEHHPERNARSFFETMVAGLRPARFWRDVQPTDAPRVARLIVYWIAATSLLLLLPAAWIVNFVTVDVRTIAWTNPLFWWAVLDRSVRHSDLWMGGVILVWPALTYAGLRIFRQSFARARLKSEHALRCALYSTDAAFWIALSVMIVTSTLGPLVPWEWRYVFGVGGFGVTAAFILATYTTYRMRCACRYYLRMDHALAMALATQVIPFLLILTLVLMSSN